ncbi:MAG: phosphoribosylaminoimidazolesuccinocarboxamide synthase [Microthrixaceae bacterium]
MELIYSGKVRDIYDAGDDRLAMVTSDRISAFDVVMHEEIPDKGRVLTATSAHWFDHLASVGDGSIGSHLISTDLADVPDGDAHPEWAGRVMLTRRAEMLPVEAIVRGYVSGSAWREYSASGTIHGMAAPEGLVESSRLPQPMYTPSTKAAVGDHDENISVEAAADLLGGGLAQRVEAAALAIFAAGSAAAERRGLILADTKFEFGLIDDRLVLCDEVLTPDSSRVWPAEGYAPGGPQPAFDKEPLRAWLSEQPWDKTPPPPTLPPEVVAETAARYREAYARLTGRSLDDWPGAAT